MPAGFVLGTVLLDSNPRLSFLFPAELIYLLSFIVVVVVVFFFIFKAH